MLFIESEIDPQFLIAVSPIEEQKVRVPGAPTGIQNIQGKEVKQVDKIVTVYCLSIVVGSKTMGVTGIMEQTEDKGIAEAARARLVGVIKEREKKQKV